MVGDGEHSNHPKLPVTSNLLVAGSFADGYARCAAVDRNV
jgi:hypothetical protein